MERWLKPGKKGDKSEEKQNKPEEKSEKDERNTNATLKQKHEFEKPVAVRIIKFKLECPKSTCKYKKTIIKKNLEDKDKICPRCKSKMNVK